MRPGSRNPHRGEIVLIARSDKRRPDVWERAETIAKIVSLIAIPIVLAVLGGMLQDQLTARAVSKDYVQVAVSVLMQRTDVDPALRAWAVDLLNANSPTKFSLAVETQLKSGVVTLPPDRIQHAHEYKLVWFDHLDRSFWEVMRTDTNVREVRNEDFKSWCIPFDESRYIIFKKRLIAADEEFKGEPNWWVAPPYNLPALNPRWLQIMDDEQWFFYEVESR